ncbi:unnamed protein product, partial [Symbiodinium necroappetens]
MGKKKAAEDSPDVANVMAMLQSKGLLKRGPDQPEAAADPSTQKKAKDQPQKAQDQSTQKKAKATQKKPEDESTQKNKPEDQSTQKKPGDQSTQKNPEDQPQKKGKDQPQKKGKDQPQKKTQDQSQPSKVPAAEAEAEESDSEGPFVEWPPEKPIGPFLEVGLNVMVEWSNLDNVWKACRESDREFYKTLEYEELLQMMEVAGEERHPGPVLEVNNWNGSPSPATKEKDPTVSPEEVRPTNLGAKFNHVQRSNSERSLTTLVLGAHKANEQAYKDRPPSVVAGGDKGEAAYEGLVSASQVGSDSDLRSLVTSMQSEITRLKALLDAKPPAATTSAEPKREEQEGDEDDDEEDDDEEEAEEEGDDEYETPPPKGTKPADDSVTKGPKSNKGPNSTTHRAAWMKFGRRMDSQGSEFPEMSKMWNGSKEETWNSTQCLQNGWRRTKIENIVRKGGTPDPDAPQCLESIIYLCRKKTNVDESEKVSQTGEVKAGIKASAKAVAPLMHLSGMPAPTTSGNTDAVLQLAANVLASGTKSALSGDAAAAPKKAPKSKAKSKSKALLQAAKTTKDLLEDCKELKKEYTAANICCDLPKNHPLRKEMEKHKGDLENQMDLLKEVDDEEAQEFIDNCKAMVEKARMTRAQVRAVDWTLGARAQHLYIEGSSTSTLRDELDRVSLGSHRLAKTIGRGYASVKHASEIGGALVGAMAKAGHLDMLVADWDMVARLYAFVTGFRGDWKALRQAFNFNRYADRDKA